MNDTRNEIIRIGNELVRSVGYNMLLAMQILLKH